MSHYDISATCTHCPCALRRGQNNECCSCRNEVDRCEARKIGKDWAVLEELKLIRATGHVFVVLLIFWKPRGD